MIKHVYNGFCISKGLYCHKHTACSRISVKSSCVWSFNELLKVYLFPETVYCSTNGAQCTAETVCCSVNGAQCTEETVYCSTNGAQCTAETVCCSINGAQCTAETVYCSTNGAQCTAETVYCSTNGAQCTAETSSLVSLLGQKNRVFHLFGREGALWPACSGHSL